MAGTQLRAANQRPSCAKAIAFSLFTVELSMLLLMADIITSGAAAMNQKKARLAFVQANLRAYLQATVNKMRKRHGYPAGHRT